MAPPAPGFVIESVEHRLMPPPEPRRGLITQRYYGQEWREKLKAAKERRTGKPLSVLSSGPDGRGTLDDAREPAKAYPQIPWARLVLKEDQAAEFLKCSPQTLRKRAASGEVPRYAVGGEWRYYVYDLLDYV